MYREHILFPLVCSVHMGASRPTHLCQSISMDVLWVVLYAVRTDCGLPWTYRSHLLCRKSVCLRPTNCGETKYLALAAEDACPRDSFHGCRRAGFCHARDGLPYAPLICRRRLREEDMKGVEEMSSGASFRAFHAPACSELLRTDRAWNESRNTSCFSLT